MKLMQKLQNIWKGDDCPFFICGDQELRFSDIVNYPCVDLSEIQSGDVVALIGDFEPSSILSFLGLIDRGAIVVPLTVDTKNDHDYFFEAAHVNYVIELGKITKRENVCGHELISDLKAKGHPGLILFTSGTTGRPKAILHDFTLFLKRFDTPRPALRTLAFLLFDHIGGINTFFHTLFNKGVVVVPSSRGVDSILASCNKYQIEVLPTTPTFLRLMLISGCIPDQVPQSLRVITYGTERMDQPTLDQLCELLPKVDFRQTFGMSELGIVRVKSKARNSLFMKIGGEGIETKVVEDVLYIRSKTRMLGYLNAQSPFDDEGWYNTKDIVEQEGDCYKVTGRANEVFNVGGLKFMASEVERIALGYPNVSLVKAYSKQNPITGQHVEITIQPVAGCEVDKSAFLNYMKSNLQSHMVPRRVSIGEVGVGHRFKKC